jgi:hypothetical protein
MERKHRTWTASVLLRDWAAGIAESSQLSSPLLGQAVTWQRNHRPPLTPLLQLGRVARRFGSDLYGDYVDATLRVSKGHFSGH